MKDSDRINPLQYSFAVTAALSQINAIHTVMYIALEYFRLTRKNGMPMGDLFDRYADLMDEMLALYIDVAKCRDEAVSAAGVYTDCSITQELSEFMTERQNHVLREEDDSYKEDKDE